MNDKETEFMNLINHFDYSSSSPHFRGLLMISLTCLILQLYTLETENKQNDGKRIKG